MDNSNSSDDYISSSEDELQFIQRNKKNIKDRKNYFDEYNDQEFFHRFRLTKPTVFSVLEKIKDEITFSSFRNACLSPMQQLLLTLRFFASGCMLISVGDFAGVSKATAGRTVKRVAEAIAGLRSQYIKMPKTQDEVLKTYVGFYNIAKFPCVIGTIDCTHIKIQSPGGEDGEIYRCRKGFFSINVQTVADYNLKITNIVARWPGSCHDQTIFNNCNLKRQFENNKFKNSFLLGDNGYKNEKYLLTPLLNANNIAERLYNATHIKTRNTVERQYGVWKRRFPIMSLGIRVSLPLAQTIIVATAVLHNIAIDMKEPEILDGPLLFEHEDIGQEAVENGVDHARQILINEYFSI